MARRGRWLVFTRTNAQGIERARQGENRFKCIYCKRVLWHDDMQAVPNDIDKTRRGVCKKCHQRIKAIDQGIYLATHGRWV